MRCSLVFVSACSALWAATTDGFSAPSISVHQGRTRVGRLSADASESGVTRTKPMSPEEIRARMGVPEEEEPPKLFSDTIYDDIQQSLLTLEKRVKEGPGRLSMLEVEELGAQTSRIVAEMKQFEVERLGGLGSAQVLPTPMPPFPSAVSAAPVEAEIAKSILATDESEDEGPAYDGTGGLGMAKGTRNTYVIPGMDEMSPEEYQKALQQSITDRQTVRKGTGNYGNRATWDYLNNLSGDKGVLRRDDDSEQP